MDEWDGSTHALLNLATAHAGDTAPTDLPGTSQTVGASRSSVGITVTGFPTNAVKMAGSESGFAYHWYGLCATVTCRRRPPAEGPPSPTNRILVVTDPESTRRAGAWSH